MFSDEPFAFQFAVAAEVEEQADCKTGGLEIVEELGVFIAGELVECLQLDDNLTETYEVGVVFLGEGLSLVVDVERYFGLKGDVAGGQFELHGFLVDVFEEARAERAMQFDGRAGDGIGFLLQKQFGHGWRLDPFRTGDRVFMTFFIRICPLCPLGGGFLGGIGILAASCPCCPCA